MRGRLQFSLRGIIGITALCAIAFLLVSNGKRDLRNTPLYYTAASAVLVIGGCMMSCDLPRAAGIVFYWLLTAFGVFEFFALLVAEPPSRQLHITLGVAVLLSSIAIWIIQGVRR